MKQLKPTTKPCSELTMAVNPVTHDSCVVLQCDQQLPSSCITDELPCLSFFSGEVW